MTKNIGIVCALLICLTVVVHASESNETQPTTTTTTTTAPSTQPTADPITLETARRDVIRKIESTLGRPLNDVELQMIDVRFDGGRIKATLHQPLAGRFKNAVDAARLKAMNERAAGGVSSSPATTQSATP